LLVEDLEPRLAPSVAESFGVNVPITTDPGVQQMPSIAVDPHDAGHLVVSYMDYTLVHTGYAGIGVAVSHDGGTTWQHTAVTLPAGFDQGAADPVARFDDQGHVFVTFMAATFLGPKPPLTDSNRGGQRALGFQADNGVFVARSDDGGLAWQPPVPVVSHLYDGSNPVLFEVKPDLAIDTFSTLPDGSPNPNYGSLYEVWSRYYPPGQFPGEPTSTGGSHIMIAVSHDGGLTWQVQLQQPKGSSQPVTVLLDSYNSGIGPPTGLGAVNWSHVAVGPEGDVYVSLFELGYYRVYHSTDGGRSFVAPDSSSGRGFPFGLNGNFSPVSPNGLPTNHFRLQVVRAIAADPIRLGSVYTAESSFAQDALGNIVDPGDILFSRSTDYGLTWQTTFRLGGQTGGAPQVLTVLPLG
jgi:hypothetical protein